MTLGKETAARVHGKLAVKSGNSVFEKAYLFPSLAETKLDIVLKFIHRKSIMELAQVNILRSYSRHLVSFVSCLIGHIREGDILPAECVISALDYRCSDDNRLSGILFS